MQFTGKTVEEATALALSELKITAEDAIITVIEQPTRGLFGRLKGKAVIEVEVKAKETGYVANIDALNIGKAALLLGAGREKAGDSIDFGAGVYLNKPCGAYVNKDETL